MELIIFILVVVVLLICYLIYVKKNASNGLEKRYYYRRFVRNKLQTESFIGQLQNLVETLNCGDELVNNDQTLLNYIAALEHDYKNTYSDATLKVLKRNKLHYKDKKVYSKMLLDQSEKLYVVETNLNNLQAKFKS